MAKSDFTRTSIQVEQDIANLVDSIDRSLDSSNGDTERKGHFVLSAFVSVLAVFGSILGIDYFVGKTKVEGELSDASEVVANDLRLSSRDVAMIKQYSERARSQVRVIRETKNRVAPSMQIDGSLDAIENSVLDIGSLIGADDGASSAQAGGFD